MSGIDYDKSLDNIARDIERDIEWRKSEGYSTKKQERWLRQLAQTISSIQMEQADFTSRERTFRNEILVLRDDLYKARVILTYLSPQIQLSGKYFFDHLRKEMNRNQIDEFVKYMDAKMQDLGAVPNNIYQK